MNNPIAKVVNWQLSTGQPDHWISSTSYSILVYYIYVKN
jgi:hypothetical protein